MKIRLPISALCFLTGFIFLAPFWCRGSVTVHASGTVYVPSGLDYSDATASVGTFEGLNDVAIAEGAATSSAWLMQQWRQFSPWVEMDTGDQVQVYPPLPPAGNFQIDYTSAVDEDSPLKDRPVYLVIRWLDRYFGGGQSTWHLVIHKTTGVFRADTAAIFTVSIDPAQPRLLAGSLSNAPGFPPNTVFWNASNGLLSRYENWVFAAFGAASATAQALPEIDADGDGFSNFEEWQTLTDPTDATSRLELHWVGTPTATSVTFQWPARWLYYYAVIQSETPNIVRPPVRPEDAFRAFDVQMTQTISVPAEAGRRFFAVFYWDR